jgi:hypothetical protein
MPFDQFNHKKAVFTMNIETLTTKLGQPHTDKISIPLDELKP